MAKFAEYGFNKSHTAAYAVVSYQTAWLKAHYPSAFMAATMSSELDNTDQLRVFYDDSLANQLEFLPPDINESVYRFVPVDARRIRYALGAIKGTGQAAVEHIEAMRKEGGRFADLFDFCRRTDKRIVNRRTIEALIRAGAFDTLEPNRARLIANVELAMTMAEQEAQNANQGGLFDLLDTSAAPAVEMTQVRPWDEATRLTEEKTAIGFFLSGHPFHAHADTVRRLVKTPLNRIAPKKEPQWLAGTIMGVRTKVGNRGKMAFVQLDDGTAKLEVSFFSESFDAARHKLKEDSILIVEGKVSQDDYSGGLRIIADQALDLSEARARFARYLRLATPAAQLDAPRLKALLEPFRSAEGCPVRLDYRNAAARCQLELDDSWRVRPDDALLASLRGWQGEHSVSIVF